MSEIIQVNFQLNKLAQEKENSVMLREEEASRYVLEQEKMARQQLKVFICA